jgi:uncharacterized protein DUF4491
MNSSGLLTGIATIFVIGLGFPLVIYGERLFGYLWWPYMLGLGIGMLVFSMFMQNDWLSIMIGVLGATIAWGSTELKEQAVRAELGWYPFHPNKIKPPFENVIKKWKAPHL